jgi:hypothetical protein
MKAWQPLTWVRGKAPTIAVYAQQLLVLQRHAGAALQAETMNQLLTIFGGMNLNRFMFDWSQTSSSSPVIATSWFFTLPWDRMRAGHGSETATRQRRDSHRNARAAKSRVA